MDVKEKTEHLVKQIKTCERNMQKLTNSIKTPNLKIVGNEEGTEVQAKGIHNIFNKIITENSPILRKICPLRYSKIPEHQTDLTKIEPLHTLLSLKQLSQRTEKEY
jgi:hypothetical protein